MLQTQTVKPELLELLEDLMKIEEFQNLRLVGGTSLALQIGHRVSIDIDLFGQLDVDDFQLTELLKKYENVRLLNKTKSIKVFSINGIKVDFVNYPYPWLNISIKEENIVLASCEDIGAMKIAAITQRGSKKDFIDLFFLLKQFSLKQLFEFYNAKITDGNSWIALRSMTFFEDANLQPMPKMFIEADWEEIKNEIIKTVTHYQKSL